MESRTELEIELAELRAELAEEKKVARGVRGGIRQAETLNYLRGEIARVTAAIRAMGTNDADELVMEYGGF